MTKEPFSNSRFSNARLFDSSGFTLVEVLIAAAIMAGLSLGFAEFTNHQNLTIKGNRALAERDALTNRLSRISGDPTALAISANDPSNSTAFHDCVLGGPTPTSCDTTVCNSTTPCDLTLLDSTSTVVAGPSVSSPKYYDLNGAPCTPVGPHDGNCAVQAFTKFFPSCGVSVTSCQVAKNITVVYTVQQNPNVQLAAGPAMKPAVNSVVTLVPQIGGFGPWTPLSTTTGVPQTSPADGFLVITSAFNSGIRFSTGGVQRLYVSARSTYGQGFVSATLPISAGEIFLIESTDIHDAATGAPVTSVFLRKLP